MEQIVDVVSQPIIIKLIIIILGAILISILINILKNSLNKYIIDKENWYKTKKGINIIGYIIVFVFILVIFSGNFGEVTVLLGVVGAGLTFALQEVIISIAGWAAILVGNIYKTGDRVLLGGICGDVIDFGILRTTLMEIGQWVNGDLYNGRIVKVSNSFVFKEPVYNYSGDFPFLWDEIKIPVKYGSDPQYVKEKILGVAQNVVGDYCKEAQLYWDEMIRKYLIEPATTQPMVTLVANDNWQEYTLRYVVDYKKRRSVQDLLYTRILEEFNSSDEISLASATFQIVEMPSINVKMK